ncbi:MAG TPA: hypothetical protein VK590_11940 [Saprospiraceae bacterium]|nr:hypothetical protein [Saprospiraceae bacterium]
MSSKINIILWGVSGIATPQEKQSLYSLGSPLTVLENENKIADKLCDAHLIIAHDGLPNSFQKQNNVWLIYTGGSKSNLQPGEISQSGSISWNTCFENIQNFHSRLKDKSKIANEDIDILYAIDTELEKLLEPFTNALPLDENWKGTTLQASKEKLIKEVNKKLKQ